MSFKTWAKSDPVQVARRARVSADQARQEAEEARQRADRAKGRGIAFRWGSDPAALAEEAEARERYAGEQERLALLAEAAAQRATAPAAAPNSRATTPSICGPAVFSQAEVARLRARAGEAAATALAMSARAYSRQPSSSADEIDRSWQRARDFNRTGGRTERNPR